MLLSDARHDMWAGAAALIAGVMTPQAFGLMAGLLMIWSAARLFTEWQSRRTLVSVVNAAPAGLITIETDDAGRQVLSLVWVADPGRCKRQ